MKLQCHALTMLIAGMVVCSLPALGQSNSDLQKFYQEQERTRREKEREERKREDEKRVHDLVTEDIRREQERWARPDSGPRPVPRSGDSTSLGEVVGGIAVMTLTAATLEAIFNSSSLPRDSGSARSRYEAKLDPSTETWLQDPLNKPGVPHRFDTPDGLISKVCFRPFPDVQTVVYRWDAPGEAAQVAEIRQTATMEHMQFQHPTARGLFLYVSKPSPGQQPSDTIHWLAAHRIGMTGCAHGQAYQIGYQKPGGPPEIQRVSYRRTVPKEPPAGQVTPFGRTCLASLSDRKCSCLTAHLVVLGLAPPNLAQTEYDHESIRKAVRDRPGAAAMIARSCRIQY